MTVVLTTVEDNLTYPMLRLVGWHHRVEEKSVFVTREPSLRTLLVTILGVFTPFPSLGKH